MSTERDAADTGIERKKVIKWIQELPFPETRENALAELSKLHKIVPDLAPMLWNSFGSITALLQEITNIYPAISPPTLSINQTNRLSYTLALLQCVASHPETRSHFMSAQILAYIYPLLQTSVKTPPFVLLRMISLGVVSAAVEPNGQKSINFFLNNEIIPLCLRIMACDEFELCVTAAAFIIQKILLNDAGLSFICQTYERFSHVAMVLGKLVLDMVKKPSARLLKHVLRCYVRLAHDPRAREALKQCLPDYLRDNTFETCLQEDQSAKYWLDQLLVDLGIPGRFTEETSWDRVS